jgi:hypothetical protein
MRQPHLDARTHRQLSTVIALVLGAVLLSAFGALMSGSTTSRRPVAATPLAYSAVDVVPPTPVTIVFAKPQPPHAHAVPPAVTPVRPAPAPVAAPAPVVRVTPSGCSGTSAARATAALGSLLHPVPAGVTMSFLSGNGVLKGMTYYDTHHVDIYVAPCSVESDALLRHVVAHELGHAWDSLHMTPALRADYLAARGIPAGTPWFGCDRCQDFATPAGDFAETYAQWQRGASDSRSVMAAPATPGQLAELGARFFS